MAEFTRAEIEAVVASPWSYASEDISDTITQLLAQLDAANAIDIAAALEPIAPPDVAQAARVLIPWLDSYERKVAKVWRDDGIVSKHDLCRHGLPMYNGCGDCLEEDIRAIAGETP